MTWLRQADVGRCTFIDLLEEAAMRRTPVELELASGERIHELIADVVGTPEGDVVVFGEGRREPVRSIAAMTRAGS